MAYATNMNSSAQGATPSRFAALMISLGARLARRKLYTQTLRELGALSDRDLADLGLHRSMIRRIAYQAAYEV